MWRLRKDPAINLANAVKCAAVRRCRSGVRADRGDRWAESVLECPGSIAGPGSGIKRVADGASKPPKAGPMRVLRPVVGALVAPVYDFRHDLAPGYSVGSQFVSVETIIEVTRPMAECCGLRAIQGPVRPTGERKPSQKRSRLCVVRTVAEPAKQPIRDPFLRPLGTEQSAAAKRE